MNRPARSVARRLAAATLRHRSAAAQTVLGFFLVSLSQISLTWLVKLWIEGPLNRDASSQLPLLLATVFLVALLSGAVFAAHYGLGRLLTCVIRDLRRDVQSRLLELEVAAVHSKTVGDLATRLLQDVEVAGRVGGEMLRRGLGDALVLIGALVMLLVINGRLFGLIVLIAPLGVAGHALVATLIRRLSLAAQERLGRVAARFTEQVSGFTTIKAYQAEAAEREKFAADNATHATTLQQVERWTAFSLATVWLVAGCALLGLGFYAGYAVSSGRLAAGDFLVFCLFAAQIVEPVRRLGEISTLLQRGLAAGERVYAIVDEPRVERVSGMALPAPVRGEIRFDCVRFGYASGRAVLDDVSFAVPPRTAVAIVSSSGGGKSTIASLLVRFFDAQAGTVSLDGLDLSRLRVDAVRRAVRLVAQEPFVFAGSVRENLTYGTPAATASEIDEAVWRSGLDVWVRSLPHGLDTILTEAGRNLSGGQKQRIALARAVTSSPVVLVLDEATSAIDSDTEEQIMERLSPWLAQRTVITMAHRLATVLRMSRALVLENGRIAEDGPPDELLARSTSFTRIFREQALARVSSG